VTLAQAILQENNNQFPVSLVTRAAWHLKGVIINEIGIEMAQTLAGLFTATQPKYPKVPLVYALACCDIESVFDPNAVNGNYLGSNPTHSLGGKDVGLCQLKLKELPMTLDDAKAFAFDPVQCLPYFFDEYTGLIEWASGLQRSSAWNPKYGILAWATGAYNYGRTGIMPMLESGEDISHCDKVLNLCSWFSEVLNLPNPMLLT
jgi:hypothetical protein